MGRSSVLLWTMIASVCFIWGCGTPGRGGSLAWLRSPAAGGHSPEEEVAETNPFKRSAQSDDGTEEDETAESAGVEMAQTEGDAESATHGDMKTASHDTDTLKLIEEELQHASPEEREQMFNDLKGLEPALVREIVKMRRLVRQMGQEAPSVQQTASRPAADIASDQSDSSLLGGTPNAGTHGIRRAAVEPEDIPSVVVEQVTSFPQPGISAGLGTANPWNPPRPSFGHSSFYASHSAEDRPGPPDPLPWVHGREPRGLEETPVWPGHGVSQATSELHEPGGRSHHSDGEMSEHFRPPPDALQPGTADQYPAISSAAPSKWGDDLQKLVSLAAAETAELSLGPESSEADIQEYTEKQVYLRMLYLMTGEHERALQAIPGLEPADQEFWQQMFWAMANYFDFEALPNDGDRASQTIAQLRSAVQRLQENARLELRNVTFCHKIASYGDYERFSRDEFGRGQPVLVYAEVDNFKSEQTSEGQYRTILRSTIEIYKAGPEGGLVESMTFPATEDLCRNHRRDYFHSYEFTIPPAQKISLGPHVMKLIVEDQLSQKVATYSLNFTVK